MAKKIHKTTKTNFGSIWPKGRSHYPLLTFRTKIEWQHRRQLRGSPMANSSSSSPIPSLIFVSPTIQIKDMSEQNLIGTIQMFNELTGSGAIPDDCDTKAFYSHITNGHVRQLHRERGRLTYLLCVKPAVAVIS